MQEILVAAGISASAAIVVGILSALAAYLATKRDRRRHLYGEAYKAALTWREMLYRVRRRSSDCEAERELIGRFHQIQEELDFYVGWIGSESRFMQRSYESLVRRIKTQTYPLLVQAWNEPGRSPADGTPEDEVHPDIKAVAEDFLCDVRSHLSPWPWRKLMPVWRNRHRLGGSAG